MPGRIADPFLFDAESFWGSEAVQTMLPSEVCSYLRLLSRQWSEGSIPGDPRRIAAILTSGIRIYTPAEVVGNGTLEEPGEGSLWSALSECFEADGDGRLVNPRMSAERLTWIKKKRRWSKGASKAGKASGKARRTKKVDHGTDRSTDSSTDRSTEGERSVERIANDPRTDCERPSNSLSPSLSPSLSLSTQDSEKTCTEPEPAPAQQLRQPDPVEDREAVFWFPVVKGSRSLPADARSNGDAFEFPIYREDLDEWAADFGGADVEPEVMACLRWNKRNRGKRKTPFGLKRHVSGWLERANAAGKLEGPPMTAREKAKAEVYRSMNEQDPDWLKRIQEGPQMFEDPQ